MLDRVASAPPVAPSKDRRSADATGRSGLFLGGYLALAFLGTTFSGIRHAVDVSLLGALLAAAVASGLLWCADRWRDGELDALAVMAAFGSTAFIGVATHDLGASTGADGALLFWVEILVVLPVAVATMLWMPHPILGLNVAVGSAVLVVAAPLGDGGASVPAGKALLLSFVLAGLAVLVDLRTHSRAGSLLHYSAIVTFAVAKVILGYELHAPLAGLVLAALAVGELGLSLLLRRRTWAVSGWLSLTVAVLTAAGASAAGAFLGGATAAIVAAPLIAAAVMVQREGEAVRDLVLHALPPELAASFPP